MKKKLSIAISPCPNDTFIFENIFNQSLIHPDYDFTFHFLDIEQLNDCAIKQSMDIIKISYAQSFAVQQHYTRLRSGGAMGFGIGPLLLKNKNADINLQLGKIAIPGYHTTANFLLSYLFPEINLKTELRFDKIEDAILNNEVDAGLVIHESRFTYKDKGLEKIADLGELWQQKTNLPIPLGCIVIRNTIEKSIQLEIEKMIAASIPDYTSEIILTPFIKQNAQEMNEQVMRQHIQLYVNSFSKDIGIEGENAIAKMEKIMKSAYYTLQ
jgi:1,4-dihydroxy-6-naphthoate synthase